MAIPEIIIDRITGIYHIHIKHALRVIVMCNLIKYTFMYDQSCSAFEVMKTDIIEDLGR